MLDARPETLIDEGYRARRQDRLPEAQRHFADAVVLCRKGKDKSLLAEALPGMGQIARDLGDGSGALCCYEEAVRILPNVDQPLRPAHTNSSRWGYPSRHGPESRLCTPLRRSSGTLPRE